jgi:hypothetical protein
MDQTFFVRKYHRNVGLTAVGFFGLMILLSVSVAWTAPQGRGIILAALFVTFWGLWLCVAIYTLAAYRLGRLQVAGYRVSIRGVFSSRELELTNVTALYWKTTFGSVIRLDSADERIKIELGNFERPERLQLIEFFRTSVPQEIQHGWQMFCHKIALPLSLAPAGKSVQESLKEPGAVLITRRRWDWYLLPFVAASAIGGLIAAWQLGQPQLMATWIPVTLLWLFLRYTTPKVGMVSHSISGTPGLSQYILFMLGWGVVGIGGIFAFNAVKAAIPHHVIVGAVLLLVWYAVMIGRAYLEDRRRHRRDLEKSTASELEWAMRHGNTG